jgi:transcriptional regulator with XRE-family HTH domain
MPAVDKVRLIPEAIESARRARLITAGELAAKAGVSARTLWAARHGHQVGLRTARRVAKVLRVPLASLLEVTASDADADAAADTTATALAAELGVSEG